MVELVINYDPSKEEFKIYEPTTETLLISKSLTEALVNISAFLESSGMITGDILSYPDISYHLDSYTLKAMVESNAVLLKRLSQGPSAFTIASQKFGGSMSPKLKNSGDFTKSTKSFSGRKTSKFSGKSGFTSAAKKFGGK